MSKDNILRIYVVYDHPLDYPDDYCVRVVETNPGGFQRHVDFYKNPDLNKVREWIDKHCAKFWVTPTRLDRHPNDDPVILECWL